MTYFITYGNRDYERSKARIAEEARKTTLFDIILTYGREDVQGIVANSPLFNYERGDGLWIWKPFIINQTLEKMSDGDILVYADSGCSIYPSKEWKKYFNMLNKFDMLTFLTSTIVEQYTRTSLLQAFSDIGRFWYKRYQVAAGVIILKKTSNTLFLMNEWQNLMVNKPDFVVDVRDDERHLERNGFIENRHDQSVFNCLVYKYKHKCNIKILFNRFEGGIDRFRSQAIIATRFSDKKNKSIQKRSIIKNILLYAFVKPYRNIYQFYWIARS